MEKLRAASNPRPGSVTGLAVACSIALLAIFSAPARSQPAGDPAKSQMQEMNRREIQLNNLGEQGRTNDPKRTQAMMDQVTEDFQRILTLHNQIVRSIAGNQSPGYQFISDATGEIRRRAARLQSSLKLQKPDTATDIQDKETDFKSNSCNCFSSRVFQSIYY